MITLFPDQQITVEKLRAAYREGVRSLLLVAPCGFGKTVVFCYITSGAQRLRKRVLLNAHRVELIDQISTALHEQGVRHGIIAAGYRYERGHSVYVGSVFTVVKRLDLFIPDLVVVDEAHHAAGSTTWARILAAYPQAHVLGVTATPCRFSGEGLGDSFQRLILGPTTQELINIGRLSPVRVFAPPTINTEKLHRRMGDFIKGELIDAVDKPSITGDAVAHYKRLADGKQAAAFCVSVEHAKHVAERFRAEGYPAESLDGTLDRQVRNSIVGEFKRGKIKVITSCDLISEGFDCPRIEVGIVLRPTESMGLWLQQCGRVLRTFPGKNEALLLDHAGNTLRHGLPTADRAWSLAGVPKAGDSGGNTVSVRICTACFSAQPGRRPTCGNCGAKFPIESRTVAQKKGELEELTPEELTRRMERMQVGMTKDRKALIALGTQRGYASPERWADHILGARELKKKRA